MPCDQLAAFVIYDLPGRDCAAKASNGELAAGDISTYKSEYIDREFFPLFILRDISMVISSDCDDREEQPEHRYCSSYRARLSPQLGHE